jgi:hypothetical protein
LSAKGSWRIAIPGFRFSVVMQRRGTNPHQATVPREASHIRIIAVSGEMLEGFLGFLLDIDPSSGANVEDRRTSSSERTPQLAASKHSYAAGEVVEISVEQLAAGAPLPEMPLFLRPDRYIDVPLESTYEAAYAGMPDFWRGVLECGSATA